MIVAISQRRRTTTTNSSGGGWLGVLFYRDTVIGLRWVRQNTLISGD